MKRIILIVLLVLLLIGLGVFIIIRTSSPYQGISGFINLNGVVPPGSTIAIYQRPAKSTAKFTLVKNSVQAKDTAPWQFANAKNGQSYEIQAAIIDNGKTITKSSPIFTSAPAINEILTLNVESTEIAAAAIPTPPQTQATISGNVGIDGYIPPGATISLQGRKLGNNQFSTIVSNITAIDNQVVTYTTAISGQTYEVQGLLFTSTGQQIGQSSTLVVTAPAQNETLNINSTAQPPATPTPQQNAATQAPQSGNAVISGGINFNGQTPPNSRIVIFERVTGTSQFILAQDNVQPINGSTWSWNGATTGTSYDMIAILKQKQSNGTDTDISNSGTITIEAPAANETFNINSGFALGAASGNITVSCDNYSGSNNTWQVTVSFQSITNALSYWYQIGITNGGVELTNFTANATNNTNQAYSYTFQNNTTYYARYAYANTTNLQANNPQFSPFSGTQALRCSH